MSEANRVRKVQLNFRVTEREKELIETRMQEIGTINREAYLRKIAIDGMLVKLEVPELKEIVSLMRRTSNNVNQIISSLGVTLSLLLFVTGDYKNGGIFLMLAWLISPIGLPLIAEWLWRGLDTPRGMLWCFVFC